MPHARVSRAGLKWSTTVAGGIAHSGCSAPSTSSTTSPRPPTMKKQLPNYKVAPLRAHHLRATPYLATEQYMVVRALVDIGDDQLLLWQTLKPKLRNNDENESTFPGTPSHSSMLEGPAVVCYFMFWLSEVMSLVDVKHGPHVIDVRTVVAGEEHRHRKFRVNNSFFPHAIFKHLLFRITYNSDVTASL